MGQFVINALLVLLPLGAISLWWTGSRARELATGHAATACRSHQLQFLDQSVGLTRLRPSRSARGNSVLERHYRFEYTSHGQHRDAGEVVMRGHQLVIVRLPYVRDDEGHRIYTH